MIYEKIARAVYDVEEATTTAFDIIIKHKVQLIDNVDSMILISWKTDFMFMYGVNSPKKAQTFAILLILV